MGLSRVTKRDLEEAVKGASNLRQVILKFYRPNKAGRVKSSNYLRLREKLRIFEVDASHLISDKCTPDLDGAINRLRTKNRYDNKNRSVETQILSLSRHSDRLKGFQNDLTRPFVISAIKDGCRYCGERNLRMTLDRIDNSKGHTQDNVIAACIRCNMARRDMPIYAWLIVSKSMREARERGLFGQWTGSFGGKK